MKIFVIDTQFVESQDGDACDAFLLHLRDSLTQYFDLYNVMTSKMSKRELNAISLPDLIQNIGIIAVENQIKILVDPCELSLMDAKEYRDNIETLVSNKVKSFSPSHFSLAIAHKLYKLQKISQGIRRHQNLEVKFY